MKKHNFTTTQGYAKHVLKQANIVLDKCKIYGEAEDRKGLMTDIMKSIEAKSWLFEIFKNSPCHNGKGQLIIPMEVERPIDNDIIFEYADYIKRIAEKYLLKEAEIDGYTYKTAKNEMSRIERFITAVNYMRINDDDITIKGKPFAEYRKQHNALGNIIYKFDVSTDYYYFNSTIGYVMRESKSLYDKALLVSNAIKHCIGKQLENAEDIEKLAEAFPNCQCREGIKITKLVQRCLKEIGLYQLAIENEQETFNKRYANWCDAISPMKVKKWSVLSINFVDFLTMSHGNSWTSCLNTDKRRRFTGGNFSDGFNSRRVLDYALDPSTMVFYTIDEDYDGDDWELQPKNTRQLFHFGENKLIQARLYPQDNVSRRNIYTQYRENVEKLLADAMGEANLWSSPERGTIDPDDSIMNTPYKDSEDGSFIDFTTGASHAYWENDFKSEVNYVVFRGSTNRTDNRIPMIVGSTDAVCIMCGDPLYEGYNESIECSDCHYKYY